MPAQPRVRQEPRCYAGLKGACVAVAVFAGLLSPASATPAATASVRVTINVEPIAQIEFPAGLNFTLYVPEHDFWPIFPAIIPFKVHGNAVASVTVRPDDFLRISYGPYLGLARRSGSWGGGEDDHDEDWHHHDMDKREDGRSVSKLRRLAQARAYAARPTSSATTSS